jgi:hypothetical protein
LKARVRSALLSIRICIPAGPFRRTDIASWRIPSGYFSVGIKSYGRAPTFLLATGHEQVRSVVAHLAGDEAAALDVRLTLPETGVCSTDIDGAGEECCGGPAPANSNACCVADATARAAGKPGCGCG